MENTIQAHVESICRAAKEASREYGSTSTAEKNALLCAMADQLTADSASILAANAEDLAAAAENGGTSLFISIHMNAFPAPQYSGMQVWYGTGDSLSAEVAGAIQAASLAVMPENHRQIKAAGSNIYLLDRIQSPAVLVECGFLSNPAEAERLAREDYQRAVAAVVFAGVMGR